MSDPPKYVEGFQAYIAVLRKSAKLIYISGKGGVGKSTLSDMLEKHGFIVIHLDDLIREKIQPNHPDCARVFQLYMPDKFPAEKQKLIAIVRALIQQNADKPIVVEGTIKDAQMIKDMFKGNVFDFVYVRPTEKGYSKAIAQRFEKDRQTKEHSLGYVWTKLEKLGMTGVEKILPDVLKEIVAEQMKLVDAIQNLYAGFELTIVVNNFGQN